jgi:hypothetical protein
VTPEQADIAFLLLRAGCAGSCSFSSGRWTGSSSNALVSLAYGGKQDEMPWDRSDYAACVRTVRRLPKHRQTPEVMAGLRRAREAYLKHNPEDANALARRARQREWERERQQKAERQQANFKRRMRRKYGPSMSPADTRPAENTGERQP